MMKKEIKYGLMDKDIRLKLINMEILSDMTNLEIQWVKTKNNKIIKTGKFKKIKVTI
jgi:hypothetical protein